VGYFTKGEDVGDVEVLARIARECSVFGVLDNPGLDADVITEETNARDSGVQGVPLITFQGHLVSEGAAPEEMLAVRLKELSEESRGENAD
jgi:predicted DsbA family dithiol-disulfide isomerase